MTRDVPRHEGRTGTVCAWDYALSVYGQPMVAEACLLLQDRVHVDVTVLLFAMYSAHYHGDLAASDVVEFDRSVQDWRAAVTQSLRRLRIAMKSDFAGAPAMLLADVRGKVAAAELAAEHVAFQLLDKACAARGVSAQRQIEPREVPRAVALHFARASGVDERVLSEDDIQRALSVLGAARVHA